MSWKILAAAGALALAVLFWLDPEKTAVFPRCPFWVMSGWKCPGCGSQRAVHALLHGEVARAFQHNALLVLAIPYLVAGAWAEWGSGGRKSPEFRRRWFGPAAARVWLVLVIAWWIGRNVFNF